MKRLMCVALAPIALSSLAACGGPSDPELSFSQARIRAPLGDRDVTAAYLTIANTGGADRLIAAESTAAGAMELHTHIQVEDRMRMERVEAIEVPARGEASLAPMGDHLMLFEVEGPLELNTYHPIALTFETSGDRIVYALVVEDPTEVIEEPHDHDGDGVPDHAPGEHDAYEARQRGDHDHDHDHDHGEDDGHDHDHDHGDHDHGDDEAHAAHAEQDEHDHESDGDPVNAAHEDGDGHDHDGHDHAEHAGDAETAGADADPVAPADDHAHHAEGDGAHDDHDHDDHSHDDHDHDDHAHDDDGAEEEDGR